MQQEPHCAKQSHNLRTRRDLRADVREVHPCAVAQVLRAMCGIHAHLAGPPFSTCTCLCESTTHAQGGRDHPKPALAVTLQACTAQTSAFRPVCERHRRVGTMLSQVPLRRAPPPLTDRPLEVLTGWTSPTTRILMRLVLFGSVIR